MTNTQNDRHELEHDLAIKLSELVSAGGYGTGYSGYTELELLSIAQELISGMIRAEVRAHRECGNSWEVIADQLGVSRQAAWERFRN